VASHHYNPRFLIALKQAHVFLADLGGGDARNSRLSVRGKSSTGLMIYASVNS
jgi:hypothetical protein